MSFFAQVFRVLIASPSDVSIERDIAVRAIQDWNDLNALQRNLVLLPVRWETHSAPEYGKRPQEIINKQLVDDCDLLVGIFWTRLGSPTGNAESGTVEEIERIAQTGRPVMLYFSKAKQDLDKIEIDQLQKLRDFKNKTFPNALVESYADHVEFKEKLSKQLEIQLRYLVIKQGEKLRDNIDAGPLTDIRINFADIKSGENIGEIFQINSRLIEIQNFSKIPDYSTQKNETVNPSAKNLVNNWLSSTQISNSNKEYFRQKITSVVLQEFFKPFRFTIKNYGRVGARDIRIEITLKSKNGPIILLNREKLSATGPSKSISAFDLSDTKLPCSPGEVISQKGDIWNIHIDIPTLQPQREFSPEIEFFIASELSNEVEMNTKIFADTLEDPIFSTLRIKIETLKMSENAENILNKIIGNE
ncbi:hypothetical protein [Undibacterium sp.]|uniref:hypothetical protein n=1 Tax=Undibacterium sp. TaxID=1914977 RepID=UPI0025D214FE|nr:hypothetical protein [Undibacterium sp.]